MDNSEYIILLQVAEGVGLDLSGENVVITASLGGNKLETQIVKPGSPTTSFHNNLIWETDKKSVKRMKTENLPIKVEAFTSHITRGQEVRNLIGYILIPIRGVPIVRKVVGIRPHWYKLIGLNSEWKMNRPEVSVFLTITDKQSFEHNGILDKKPSVVESEESIPMQLCSTVEMLTSQQGLYIQLLQEEGLLQVGDLKSDCDIFIVRVTFKSARHLEYLINSEDQTNMMFQLHYSLLGTPSYCTLEPKENGVFNIQEKIAINFRTSLASLNEYFNKIFYLPVDVYYSETVVGHAKVRFINLLNSIDMSGKFKNIGDSFETDGTIPIETLFDLPPIVSKPFIEYVFNIKYMSSTKISSCEVIHYKPHVVEYRDNQAGGDGGILHGVELPPTEDDAELREPSRDLRPVQSDSILDTQDDHDGRIPKPARSNPLIIRTPEKFNMEELLMDKGNMKTARDAPRAFSFTLFLQTVKFARRPEMGIWQISLHHQKADTPYTIANVELSEICSNVIEFNNLELQLVFASTADEILNLVESESCVLNINGPRGMHATADIDNEVLLVSTKDKHSGVVLLENKSGEKVGLAHIYVSLDDLGISFNSQIKNRISSGGTQKTYMDEGLAYKIVEELEEWKHTQQETFLVELKRKEVNHLAMLSAEWQKQKMEQETKLAEKLRECTVLSEALEEANKEIEEKGVNRIEQERLMEQIKTEMEERFSMSLLDINEKSRRLEDDLNHTIKLEQLKYRELELSKGLIERDNQKLKAEIVELNEKIAEMKKTFLPKEQLAGLFQDVRILSERLDEVQKSKIFYKDQWAKIIREVHMMKAENLKQIELRLKHCRNIRLENVLENEQSELFSEKRELTVIQEALESDDENIDEESLHHQCLLKCANN